MLSKIESFPASSFSIHLSNPTNFTTWRYLSSSYGSPKRMLFLIESRFTCTFCATNPIFPPYSIDPSVWLIYPRIACKKVDFPELLSPKMISLSPGFKIISYGTMIGKVISFSCSSCCKFKLVTSCKLATLFSGVFYCFFSGIDSKLSCAIYSLELCL